MNADASPLREAAAETADRPDRRVPRPLTGNAVYNHYVYPCPYRLHLDLFGDRAQRTPPGVAARYFMERGIRHEAAVFDRIRREAPQDWIAVDRNPALDHETDLARRADATREALRAGIRFVLHGVLRAPDGFVTRHSPGGDVRPTRHVLRGETDILERVESPSTKFGSHSYVVGDVKSSRHARFAQKMQVAFYSVILSEWQGTMPASGYIVTGADEREDFAIDELLPTLTQFLDEEIHEVASAEDVDYCLAPACRSCHWLDHCRDRAAAEDDVSLLPGVRASHKRVLFSSAIGSRQALLATDDGKLRSLARAFGGRGDAFVDLKRVGLAQVMGRPVPRPETPAARARTSAGHAPDLYSHSGPVLLVAGIGDSWRGEEAALATATITLQAVRERRGIDPASLRVHIVRPDEPFGSMLRELFKVKNAADRVLAQRRERALLVFANGSMPHRLRRTAESLSAGAASAFVEGLLADALVLPRLVERTCFIGIDASGPRELADALGLKTAAGDIAPAAHAEALAALVDDFGLDGDELASDAAGLRAIAVRELREGGHAAWREFLAGELRRDIEAALSILGHLLERRGP